MHAARRPLMALTAIQAHAIHTHAIQALLPPMHFRRPCGIRGRWHILAGRSRAPTTLPQGNQGHHRLPMSKLSLPSAAALHMLPSALPLLAWLLALACCAWVATGLLWQFAAPEPVAAITRHETDARKVAARIDLHLGQDVPPRALATTRVAAGDNRYSITGIATGFGTLPGFVILQAADGSTLSLSPGQTLPDGRVLTRLLAETAEFERDGQRSLLALPPRTGGQFEPGRDTARPPTPVNGPSRDH